MDRVEIKLDLIADDLTVFLRNDGCLRHLLALISKFGICSGLVINNLVPRVYSAFKMAAERRPWHTPL